MPKYLFNYRFLGSKFKAGLVKPIQENPGDKYLALSMLCRDYVHSFLVCHLTNFKHSLTFFILFSRRQAKPDITRRNHHHPFKLFTGL